MFGETVGCYFLVEVGVGLVELFKQVLKLGVVLLLVFQNTSEDLNDFPPLACVGYEAC